MKLIYFRITTCFTGYYAGRIAYRANVLSYYITNKLRDMKFETDGTFDAIIIEVGADSVSAGFFRAPVDETSFVVRLPFDFERYDKSDPVQRCYYYMELIQQGVIEAARYKNIPYDEIIGFANELAANGFVYTRPYRNMLISDYGLKVKFTSEITTHDFQLKLQAFKRGEKKPVCEGLVARTIPDKEVYSIIAARRIKAEDGKIVFKNTFNRNLFTIDIKSLIEGYLIIEYSESPYPENTSASETFYDIQNWLKYDGHEI